VLSTGPLNNSTVATLEKEAVGFVRINVQEASEAGEEVHRYEEWLRDHNGGSTTPQEDSNARNPS